MLLPIAPILLLIAKIALIGAALYGAYKLVSQNWDEIVSVFQYAVSEAVGFVVDGFWMIVDFFRDLFVAIGQIAVDGWNQFVQAAKDAASAVISFFKPVADFLSGIFDRVRGAVASVTGSARPLPQAANGGILTGPRSGYLAVLHGTELVVPESKFGSIGSMIGNRSERPATAPSGPVNITVNQLPGESTEALAARIANHWRRRA